MKPLKTVHSTDVANQLLCESERGAVDVQDEPQSLESQQLGLRFSSWLDFLTDHPEWLESELLSAKTPHLSLGDGLTALAQWKQAGRPNQKAPHMYPRQTPESVGQWVADWKAAHSPD